MHGSLNQRFHEKKEIDQLEHLKGFQIIEVKKDEELGIRSVEVRGAHAFLDPSSYENCSPITLRPLKDLFEPSTVFRCRNADY